MPTFKFSLKETAVLLLAGLLFAGCRTPLPSRTDTSRAWRVGPFAEGAATASGASMLAVRPFFSHEEAGTNELARSVTDILWPLGTVTSFQDNGHWRFLLFYGTHGSTPDAPDAYRFRFFPFYYQGRTRFGEDYFALFPIGGKICNFMTFSRARFVLFPLYADGVNGGVEFRTWLWPFYLERHGKNVDQFRLWPFYGTREHRSLHQTEKTRFVLWPLWTETEKRGAYVNGDGFVLFPLFGHSEFDRAKRGREESWSLLPPLFSYSRGDDGYRRWNAPWPFIRGLDMDDRYERHFWPLAGVSTNAHLQSSYFLWPLFTQKTSAAGGTVKKFTHAPFPLFYRQAEYKGAAPESVGDEPLSSYTRVWPLFSHRKLKGGGTFTRVPELSLWGGSEQVERNWAPLWSLYTRRERSDGASCTDLLWGFLSWGRDGKGRGFFQFLWFLNFGKGSRDEARLAPEEPAGGEHDVPADTERRKEENLNDN